MIRIINPAFILSLSVALTFSSLVGLFFNFLQVSFVGEGTAVSETTACFPHYNSS